MTTVRIMKPTNDREMARLKPRALVSSFKNGVLSEKKI